MPDITTIDLGMPGPTPAAMTTAQYNAITTVTGRITVGSGSPEGAVTGNPGQLYLRVDGDILDILWRKVTGTATNTGWYPINGASPDRWESGFHADDGAATFSTKGLPAVTTNGTLSTGDTAGGHFVNLATGAVSGNKAQVLTAVSYQPQHGVDATFRVRTVNAGDLAGVRLWVGLIASDPAAGSTPVINMAAFRYDDSIDGTTWRVRNCDGVGSNTVDTGVALAAATAYTLRIVLDGTTARYYVNDAFTNANATNPPTATVSLAAYVSVTTTAAAAKNVRAGFLNVLSR